MSAVLELEKSSVDSTPTQPETPRIELTPAQERARDGIINYVRGGNSKPIVFSGLAGTGKTTTIIEIVKSLKDLGHSVAVCTPTGKAASVLNKKDPSIQATTLHRILTVRPHDSTESIHRELDFLEEKHPDIDLRPQDIKDKIAELYKKLDNSSRTGGNLSFTPRPPAEVASEYSVLLFDESSMIGYHKTYVPLIEPHASLKKIFAGDGAQLPPVQDTGCVDWDRPDYNLTQILRQAADSGILNLAHRVHSGRMPSKQEIDRYSDVSYRRSGDIEAVYDLAQDHQFIVNTNQQRHTLNKYIRALRGWDGSGQVNPHLPLPGETLLVDSNLPEMRLTKGDELVVKSIDEYLYNPRLKSADYYVNRPYEMLATVVDRYGNDRTLKINLRDLIPEDETALVNSAAGPKNPADNAARRAARGAWVSWPYAITCHKAQGSEYDKVCACGGSRLMSMNDRSWWYTAATRAKKELVLASRIFA